MLFDSFKYGLRLLRIGLVHTPSSGMRIDCLVVVNRIFIFTWIKLNFRSWRLEVICVWSGRNSSYVNNRGPHKDELQSQCSAMLQQGTIRSNSLAFSSSVLLVKKHDGTWRFWVDYYALNDLTVKEKFLIPVVDKLIDELRGACFFSKLDLLSRYHQVWMHPAGVEKTAFRTGHGHFEFLVMPFGLTNASATFQALMDEILWPYLRCFARLFWRYFDFQFLMVWASATPTDHLIAHAPTPTPTLPQAFQVRLWGSIHGIPRACHLSHRGRRGQRQGGSHEDLAHTSFG